MTPRQTLLRTLNRAGITALVLAVVTVLIQGPVFCLLPAVPAISRVNLGVLPHAYSDRKNQWVAAGNPNRVMEWYEIDVRPGLRQVSILSDLGFSRHDLAYLLRELDLAVPNSWLSRGALPAPGLFLRGPTDDGNFTRWTLTETGWPMRSFYAVNWSRDDRSVGQQGAVRLLPERMSPAFRGGIGLAAGTLAIMPEWKGLLADAGAWWAIWFVVVGGIPLWRAARRFRRWRIGLCVRCAYNLSGSPNTTCPECGTVNEARPPAPAT